MSTTVESYAFIKALSHNRFKTGYDRHHHIPNCAWCKVMWYWQSNIHLVPRLATNTHGFSNIPGNIHAENRWNNV